MKKTLRRDPQKCFTVLHYFTRTYCKLRWIPDFHGVWGERNYFTLLTHRAQKWTNAGFLFPWVPGGLGWTCRHSRLLMVGFACSLQTVLHRIARELLINGQTRSTPCSSLILTSTWYRRVLGQRSITSRRCEEIIAAETATTAMQHGADKSYRPACR